MSEYSPSEIEPKWRAFWDRNKTFKVETPGKKKVYVLDMFPYPSGSGLHVGHPLGYTGTDIYCRFMRMRGYSVLHPMGWDAFGLPAEQHAVSTGEHPGVITKKNCEAFKEQLKLVGISYDWDREIATCDPEYYKWTQWIFLEIYNSWFDESQNRARPISELPIPDDVRRQGPLAIQEYQAAHRLAYYADTLVNWCPALGTVLANEEVIDGKSERGGHDVVRKPMKQWMMRITKYAQRLLGDLDEIQWPESIKEQQRNWIGRKEGAEIVFRVKDRAETLTAFTTRPDTLFGVTYFVISPEHPLVETLTTAEHQAKVSEYCEQAKRLSDLARTIENRKKTGVFTGSFVVNPINNEAVPVYVGDYVLVSVGTGAVMGVPAHDERDFEFARTFQLEIRPVIVPADRNSEHMQATIDGEIAWTEPGVMLPCDAAVARELQLAGKSNQEAADLITSWLSRHSLGRKVINYKLRDWVFSRQRYWGEPIPVIHWDDGTITSLSVDELPLVLPEIEEYKPSEGGESPLARATEWVQVTDKKTGRKGRRETNTMPNWAGSCWYYLRFIDPTNRERAWDRELEKQWMPVDLYVGGAEHAVLHLLYARFWHKVLFDLGHVSTNEPFQRLFNQGMIQAYAYENKRGALVPVNEVEHTADGTAVHSTSREVLKQIVAKMSKSLRNVVGLQDIVQQYGADTLRMYLMFMGPLDTGRVWDPRAITGNFRFLKRAWQFVTENRDAGVRDTVPEESEDRAVKRAIHLLVKRVSHDIERLEFNTAIAAMMEFLNEVGLQGVSKGTLERFVLVLSPFAPHMAEECWERLGAKDSVAKAQWPSWDESLLAVDTVTVVIQVNGKKRGVIEVSPSIEESALREQIVSAMAGTNFPVKGSDRIITVYHPGTKTPRLVNVLAG